MLYYDKIDVSGETDIQKTSASKECDICHYWYFLNKGFQFQPYICNGCRDLFMMSMNSSCSDYCCIISGISKTVAINLMENIDSTEKSRTL